MTGEALGCTRWVIPEGYIPSGRTGAGRAFESVIRSDVPIVVQHTRLDSRQAALALLTTIAFPAAAD